MNKNDLPNQRERKALEHFCGVPENILPGAGKKTMASLLEKGWIVEVAPYAEYGDHWYMITPAGDAVI